MATYRLDAAAVYRGRGESIDHVLVSRALPERVVGVRTEPTTATPATGGVEGERRVTVGADRSRRVEHHPPGPPQDADVEVEEATRVAALIRIAKDATR